mmetsp:Transcript_21332/g.63931  ORF Transcript_21332/g.63931 Transcript_21332/m.63931 type:complete len:420 (+) Transcript_21332:678-1937(+)
MAVRALVALHAHRARPREHRKRLPDLVVQAKLHDGVDVDLVHQTQRVQLVTLSDVAEHAHREARARERVARNEALWHAQQAAHGTHLVLKQLTERLDERKLQVLGQPAHVMVALDGVRVLLAAAGRRARLNHVGVQRPLHQELALVVDRLLELVAERLEDLDELAANCLALVLRVGQALEPRHHRRDVVDARDGQVQVVLKRVHHALTLVEAQQPIVDKHAVQTVAQDLVHERRGHGGVDAAGECADGVVIRANLRLNLPKRLVEHLLHRPVGGEARNVGQEVLDHVKAAVGVHHLGMELEAKEAALRVLNRDDSALLALRDALEALGKLGRVVAVAHPHVHLSGSQVGEQPGVGQHVHGHAAVLGLPLGVLHGTSQLVHHELHAVADAQHWDVVGEHPVEELVRHARGTLLVHAVGAA